MATIEQMKNALSRYYAALNQPYDNIFTKYCDENGIDANFGMLKDEIYELFNDENGESPESLLIEFNENFPFLKTPSNKMQFMCYILTNLLQISKLYIYH